MTCCTPHLSPPFTFRLDIDLKQLVIKLKLADITPSTVAFKKLGDYLPEGLGTCLRIIDLMHNPYFNKSIFNFKF